jgi:hypothetical protein
MEIQHGTHVTQAPQIYLYFLFINAAHELPFAEGYGSFGKQRSGFFPKGTCGTTHNEVCRDPNGTRYFCSILFIY